MNLIHRRTPILNTPLNSFRHQRFHAILATVLATLTLALTLALGGCSDPAPQPQSSAEVRAISLSPAISRTLVDLNLGHLIVGRTPWCNALDQTTPIVGDLFDTDLEAIIKLDPTHILVQPTRDGLSAELAALAEQHNWSVHTWTLNTLDDVEQLVMDLPPALFDETDDSRDDFESATRRAAEIINDIATAVSPPSNQWTGSTIILSGVDPILAFGTKTYIGDLLERFGSTNAVPATGWPELSLEDIQKLNPQAIIRITAQTADAEDPLAAIGTIATLDIDAIRANRVAVMVSPDAATPSSAVRNVARELSAILETFARESDS